jgi:glycerol-3-phosphate dehydrogenase subunit B
VTADRHAARPEAPRPEVATILVIGAGLSGLMAAHTAVNAGFKVKVIARGLGALHWSAGTVDLLGYTAADPRTAVKQPLETIRQLAETEPGHPYSLIGQAKLARFLDDFVALTHTMGLPYGGAASAGHNLLLPSPAGAARPTYLAPQAQLAGDLSRPEPMLIVGFEGLRDFYPQLIADNLQRQGYRARAAFLPFNVASMRRDANMVHLAAGFDEVERRRLLARALKQLVRPGERIGLPAMLGLHHHTDVMTELAAATGAPIFEVPTLPPSVPGVRLFLALQRRLRDAGVPVEAGMEVINASTVASGTGDGRRVEWVESETSSRPLRHRADYFVLASGGILGGGFDSDSNGRVWETIFNLPVTAPQRRSQWFHSRFLAPEGHAVFRGGVAVDGRFRPLTETGACLYDNLLVAGNLLAHSDPVPERSLEGVAIATGMASVKGLKNG